jgi:WD40 repeat protein
MVGCGAAGVQPLVALDDSEQADASKPTREPSASDYSAYLDVLALGYADGSFEVRSPAPLHVLARGKHDAPIVNVALSSDGQRLATVDQSGTLAVSDIDSGALGLLPRAHAEPHYGESVGLAWDHTGKRLAVAAVRSVRLIPLDDGESKEVELDGLATAVAFDPGDSLLAVAGERFTLLQLPSLEPAKRPVLPEGVRCGHQPGVLDVRFSADGQTLGALCADGIALFDLRSGKAQVIPAAGPSLVGLRLAADGKIALFSRHSLYVGDPDAALVKARTHDPGGTLYDVWFRRDDSLLVFGSGVNAELEQLQ